MPTIKKSNIFNYLKSKFSNTSSDIKMNGTQSAGSVDRIARADHVHPTDTSRAAASHTHTKANITDFPSTMTPSSHNHGDITNAGAIGSAANKPLITGSNGKITTGNFGTGANTFCEGNDSRLSDARMPISHATGTVIYGGGTASNYGHVKLSDSYQNSGGNANSSVGASSKALVDCYNTLNSRIHNEVLYIEVHNGTEYLILNFDTGMGMYSLFQPSVTPTSFGGWVPYKNLNDIVTDDGYDLNGKIINLIGTVWTGRILYSGNGAIQWRIKGSHIYYWAEGSGTLISNSFILPFFFELIDEE